MGEPNVRPLIIAEQLRQKVPGGIGTYIKGLAEGLHQIGGSPSTLASRGNSLASQFPSIDQGRQLYSALPPKVQRVAWDYGVGVGSRSLSNCSVLHATSLLLPRRPAHVPLTVFVHDVSFLRYPDAYPARGLRWHRAALDRARKRADLFLVPSAQVADDLVKTGIDANRIAITGEGSDHLAVQPRTEHQAPFILSVGTLQPRKNLARLIEAYARIRHRLPQPFPLRIVGPDGWGENGAATIPADQLQGVEWLGSVSEASLVSLYASAHLFAYVPLDEGFGLPVVEAQRAGLAVVASTGVPAAASRPKAALLVDCFDTVAIGEALVQASTDDAWRAAAITAGLVASSQQTWALTATKHVEAWTSCL